MFPIPCLGEPAADSAVHFCHRPALRLLWRHEKQGQGLDQGHVVAHPGKEEAIRKDCGDVVFMFLYHKL